MRILQRLGGVLDAVFSTLAVILLTALTICIGLVNAVVGFAITATIFVVGTLIMILFFIWETVTGRRKAEDPDF